MKQWCRLILLLASLQLVACSAVPKPIRQAPPDNPSLAQVRDDPECYRGKSVRWGGTIARVENRDKHTLLEVVARDLDGGGEPRLTDESPGRFLAVIDGFLDPAIHAAKREITVAGTLSACRKRKLGQMDYLYPVISVEHHYLWPRRLHDCRECPPAYRDPWPRFGYPYYPWPYYPPPH